MRDESVMFSVFQGYDDQQSTVRKSAVFCLVAIYLKVGEGIWNHLTKLNYSKVSIEAVEKCAPSSAMVQSVSELGENMFPSQMLQILIKIPLNTDLP